MDQVSLLDYFEFEVFMRIYTKNIFGHVRIACLVLSSIYIVYGIYTLFDINEFDLHRNESIVAIGAIINIASIGTYRRIGFAFSAIGSLFVIAGIVMELFELRSLVQRGSVASDGSVYSIVFFFTLSILILLFVLNGALSLKNYGIAKPRSRPNR